MLSPCMLPKTISSETTCNINPLGEASKSTSSKLVNTASNLMKDMTKKTGSPSELSMKEESAYVDLNESEMVDISEQLNNDSGGEPVEEKKESVQKAIPSNGNDINQTVESLFEENEEDRSINPDIKSTAPLLKGSFSVKDDRIVWEGLWGMTEAAFSQEGGVTSKFQLVSIDSPHSDMLDSAEDSPSTCILYNTFNGHFQLQTSRGRMSTVSEKSLLIGFTRSTLNSSEFHVRGKGSNRFGEFVIKGLLNIDTKEFTAYKMYLPKPETRAENPEPTTTHMSTRRRQSSMTKKLTAEANFLAESSLQSDDACSLSSQKRSERKRSLPAHLRDETFASGVDLSAKLDPYMRKCMTTLQYLLAHSQASAFCSPVDPIALNIPDYFDIIKEPMDLGTIRKDIENGELNDIFEFARKTRLVFTNAITYNKPEHPIHQHAQRLLTAFNHRFQRVLDCYEKENRSGSSGYLGTPSASYGMKSQGKKYLGSLSRGGKGPRAMARSTKKASKQSQIEMMRQEIEMMRAELNSLHAQQSVVPSKKGGAIGNNKKRRTAGGKSCFRIENLTDEDLNRPMTMNEKRELSININRLPQAKIDKVVTIIGERIPLDRIQTPNDEIEIDLNSCDNSTLRIIEAYVNDALLHIRKRKRPSNSAPSNGSSGRNTPENGIPGVACITSNLQLAQQIEISTKEKIRNVQEELDALNKQGYLNDDYKAKKAKRDTDTTDKLNHGALDGETSSSSESEDLSSDSDSDDDDEVDHKLVLENLPSIRQQTVSDHSELLAQNDILHVENINAWENMVTKTSDGGNQTSLWSAALSLEKDKLSKSQDA